MPYRSYYITANVRNFVPGFLFFCFLFVSFWASKWHSQKRVLKIFIILKRHNFYLFWMQCNGNHESDMIFMQPKKNCDFHIVQAKKDVFLKWYLLLYQCNKSYHNPKQWLAQIFEHYLGCLKYSFWIIDTTLIADQRLQVTLRRDLYETDWCHQISIPLYVDLKPLFHQPCWNESARIIT